jgi:hypothetical protein
MDDGTDKNRYLLFFDMLDSHALRARAVAVVESIL